MRLCYWIVHALALLEAAGRRRGARRRRFSRSASTPTAGSGAGRGRCRTSPQPTPPSRASPGSPPSKRPSWTRRRSFLARCKDKARRVQDARGWRRTPAGATRWRWRDCWGSRRGGPARGGRVRENVPNPKGVAGEPGAEARRALLRPRRRRALRQRHSLDLPGSRTGSRTAGRGRRGFNGRTNKLVDGCYSFWQGGPFRCWSWRPARCCARDGGRRGGARGCERRRRRRTGERKEGNEAARRSRRTRRQTRRALCSAAQRRRPTSSSNTAPSAPSFSSRALQGWLLLCCQLPNGGMQDKPGEDHTHVLLPVRAERRAAGPGTGGGTGDQPVGADRSARECHRGQARGWTRLVAQLPKI